MNGSVVASLVGCLLVAATALADGPARPPLDPPSLRAFHAYLGESFQAWGGEGARAVELLRLTEIRDLGSNARIEQFSLRFRAEPTSSLGKAVYSFKHPDAGPGFFDLLLEPAGQDAGGRYFEARFSLLATGGARP